jgi:sialidase-1
MAKLRQSRRSEWRRGNDGFEYYRCNYQENHRESKMKLFKTNITALLSSGIIISFLLSTGLIWTFEATADEAEKIVLNDLYENVRMPKIVVAQDGSILAFADGCRLLRCSRDQGKSWSAQQTLNTSGRGNAIVDTQSGDVLVVCPPLSYLLRSKDTGKSWTKEEIIIKPNAIGHGNPSGVKAETICSESGITLEYGEHKGRLVMPIRIQPPAGDNAQEYWQYNYNTSIFSDDGGKTWQVGEPVQSGTGEGTLAELSDGRLYYNSRSHMSVDHRRRIAWSYDGGQRWVDWQVSDDLFEVGGPHYFKYGRKPSYGCNAGLVRLPIQTTDDKDILIYSTPDNPGAISPHNGRIRMTVWASFDSANSWTKKRLIYEGISSYSSLAADKDGNVYLLFESGKTKLYEKITFTRFKVDELFN